MTENKNTFTGPAVVDQNGQGHKPAGPGGGQFTGINNSQPDHEVNLRAELDTANQLYWENTERIHEEVALYLRFGMPEGAHRVEFEESDQGDYVYAARAFDENDQPIDTEDDFDRWAEVDEIVQLLGYPDDNRTVFSELFESEDGRVFTWKRTDETNEADEQAIRDRIDKLVEVHRELGSASQAGAVTAIRRMLPEGAKVILTWGDQPGPDYLSVEKVVLADGTELDDFDAVDAGIDWDEIDMAASDIRDIDDPNITPVEGRRDYYVLTQKAGA